jgi:hypothetical protein
MSSAILLIFFSGGLRAGDKWCGRPGLQSQRGGKTNILNKNIDFPYSDFN